MARGAFITGLTLFVSTMMWADCLAQPNCTPTIANLAPCLGFIAGNSLSAPSSTCCAQFASIVKTQTQCLCAVLNGIPKLPFVVNQTQALTLPGACKIQTTPLSQCNAGEVQPAAAGSPQGALAPASPASLSAGIAAPPTSASATPVPQAHGSKSKMIATGQSSSAKNSTNYTSCLLFLLLVASAFSAF